MVDIKMGVWLLKEKAKELIDSRIDVISISVESHDEETHDNIRLKKALLKDH